MLGSTGRDCSDDAGVVGLVRLKKGRESQSNYPIKVESRKKENRYMKKKKDDRLQFDNLPILR